MKKIDVIVADDDPYVRETFRDLVKDYRRDLARGRRDNHLDYIFNDEYDVYFNEAENGSDFQDVLQKAITERPENYFIGFVDEDMPVRKGTSAISGVSDFITTLNEQYSRPHNKETHRPKVKLVSYTQKQDIDISDGMAKESGAVLFLRKTGLNDFYEDMVKIIEHLTLDLTNLDHIKDAVLHSRGLIRIIGTGDGNNLEKFREYLNLRYYKEYLVGKISYQEQNNAWMLPDLGDFFSVPIGIYTGPENLSRLIGCIRLRTSKLQPRTTMLMEEILSSYAFSIPGLEGHATRLPENTVSLDKFYIDKKFDIPDVASKLLEYAVAVAIKNKIETIHWVIPDDIIGIATSAGFTLDEGNDDGTATMEFRMGKQSSLYRSAVAMLDIMEGESGDAMIDFDEIINKP